MDGLIYNEYQKYVCALLFSFYIISIMRCRYGNDKKIEGHFYNSKTLLKYINIVILFRLEEMVDIDSLYDI